jgi:hypothetical protein
MLTIDPERWPDFVGLADLLQIKAKLMEEK